MEKTTKVLCNKCKRELPMKRNIVLEDFIEVNKNWGYFSKKDGKTYSFVLCEECSDKLMESFLIPPRIVDTTELL
ncbi:MAG: hypothetical protein J6J16_06330 [Lachnospiraceae bacterium]|nr:hypothetical protein [Lachnospiraceae bacterium]